MYDPHINVEACTSLKYLESTLRYGELRSADVVVNDESDHDDVRMRCGIRHEEAMFLVLLWCGIDVCLLENFCCYFHSQNIDDLLHKELKLLQVCLHANPKSYGVWNQRRFVMKMMKNPNWVEELQLCNLFLQYDERNCKDFQLVFISSKHLFL